MAFLQLPTSLTLRRSTFTAPTVASSSASSIQISCSRPSQISTKFSNWVVDFGSKSLSFVLFGALSLAFSLSGFGVAEAKEGVNKPELLPKEYTTVIDVAGFLSSGQVRIKTILIRQLTRIIIELLSGLAIRDYWQVDDRTIVFVTDPTFGNILNFNVGATVDLDIPRSFWSRLAGKYGNIFYWKEKVKL